MTTNNSDSTCLKYFIPKVNNILNKETIIQNLKS